MNGWHDVGKLSKAFNSINTSKFEHVLEVKLEWDENTNPKIYEIFPVKREKVEIDTLDEELQMAYDQGWITGRGVLNSLLAKVTVIQKHGNSGKALNVLGALENQVNALKGKKIDERYADVLIGIIGELKRNVEVRE